MQKKRKASPFELLKQYVNDYVEHVEKINEVRLEAAEHELENAQKEAIAFNILRQNILTLEQDGISQD